MIDGWVLKDIEMESEYVSIMFVDANYTFFEIRMPIETFEKIIEPAFLEAHEIARP